jgi:ABC-type sugar transport system substrate-binding protein
MKKSLLIVILSITILVIGMFGVALAKENKDVTIGILWQDVTAPYFSSMANSLRDEANIQGINLIEMDAQWDSNKQLTQMQTLIAKKVDVIIVVPVDTTAIIPALMQAYNAGIPLVGLNNKPEQDGMKYLRTYVGGSMELEAQLMGKKMAEILNGKGNVVMIMNVPGTWPQIIREREFLKTIEGTEIKVLASQTGKMDRAESTKVMEDFLTRFGEEINGVYAHDDNMAVGAIAALKEKGLAGKIPVVGIGASIDGLEAIRNGELWATVTQSPSEEGRNAIRVAVDVAQGRLVKDYYEDAHIVITKDNVDSLGYVGEW